MINPRTTRLLRVADLRQWRQAIVDLTCDGAPLDARDRVVVVPTRAAAGHLRRTIERRLLQRSSTQPAGTILPDIVTPGELVPRLAERLPVQTAPLSDAEREVLLAVACRAARDNGTAPPFALRPGLIAEILGFYDELRRHQNDVETFARRALDALEPGAAFDRGAERLVRQTRFLVAAFRVFEVRSAAAGLDEHMLRARLVADCARRPVRHVVLTVGDRAFERHGLYPADWDLLTRLPGLERLDLVATDIMLAGAPHERVHQLLPGVEEVRLAVDDAPGLPTLIAPPVESFAAVETAAQVGRSVGLFDQPSSEVVLARQPAGVSRDLLFVARDREEEVSLFARRVKALARRDERATLDRIALVVEQPLPYAYVAREVLRTAAVPSQSFDTLPLAGEPYAAALDLVFSAAVGSFARVPSVALLRSPQFAFTTSDESADDRDGHRSREPIGLHDIAALDGALAEAGYLGEAEALERLLDAWRTQTPQRPSTMRAIRAGSALRDAARWLEPLRQAAPAAAHLATLIAFLDEHERPIAVERVDASTAPQHARRLRARSAVRGVLLTLRDAYARFDPTPVDIDTVAALVRRWIEAHTFAPRLSDRGVHIVDAESVRFGEFDHVQLSGLVDGEWPARPRRNIFYSPSVLRDLGWPAESGRVEATRASFLDLMRLPRRTIVVSAFSLEADAIVAPSPLVDEIERAGLPVARESLPTHRIFEHEALSGHPMAVSSLPAMAQHWAGFRRDAPTRDSDRYRGWTSAYPIPPLSLSALERYQDCPFRFFAGHVLRLEEAIEDESVLSPRARGRFIHEVFQRFFEAWDAGSRGPITTDRLDEARAVFAEVSEPLLARLPEADATLERTRLFGSAISVGHVDVMLALEVAKPVRVTERWLEHRLDGDYALGDDTGARVSLRGVADRVDLLPGRRLRVIDYKSGSAPNTKRALQVPIYALCVQEQLSARDGASWSIEDASYVAFTGKRNLVPVVTARASGDASLAEARSRLTEVLAGIARGEFPARPHDEMMCRYCHYAVVCRKDYVEDDQ